MSISKKELIGKTFIIVGDINDGDYITNMIPIKESNVDALLTLAKIFKKNGIRGYYDSSMNRALYREYKELFNKVGITSFNKFEDILYEVIPYDSSASQSCHTIARMYILESKNYMEMV